MYVVVDAFKLLFARLPHKLLLEMKFCTCIGVTQTVLSFICCCTRDWYICAETGRVIIPLMPTGKTVKGCEWTAWTNSRLELTISIFICDYQLAILCERLWQVDLHVFGLTVHLHCMHGCSITLSMKLKKWKGLKTCFELKEWILTLTVATPCTCAVVPSGKVMIEGLFVKVLGSTCIKEYVPSPLVCKTVWY